MDYDGRMFSIDIRVYDGDSEDHGMFLGSIVHEHGEVWLRQEFLPANKRVFEAAKTLWGAMKACGEE